MPIYEYRCESCGAALEKLQKLSDPPLVECPECGKYTLVKLISASSFRLKGSGWYETDFKTGNKKNGAGDADTAAGKADAGSAGKTDSGSTDSGSTESGKSNSKDASALVKSEQGKTTTAATSSPKNTVNKD